MTDLVLMPDGSIAEMEIDPVSAPPSKHHVYAERDRRLAAGFTFDFGDARGVHHIGTSLADMRGWDEVSKLADVLRRSGGGTITIATDTGVAEVTPEEWDAILLASAAMRQPIWQASFALAAMDPIPADFADDGYWAPAPA